MSFDWGAAEAAVAAWEVDDDVIVDETPAAPAAAAYASQPEHFAAAAPASPGELFGTAPQAAAESGVLSSYASMSAQVDGNHLLIAPLKPAPKRTTSSGGGAAKASKEEKARIGARLEIWVAAQHTAAAATMPDSEEKKVLAAELGVEIRTIEYWFWARNKREKRKEGVTSTGALSQPSAVSPSAAPNPFAKPSGTPRALQPKGSGGGGKKGKRDPRAPKAALTAYLHYCGEMRSKALAAHPEMSNVDRTKMVGLWWNAMVPDEKQPYVTEATEDKARYNTEMKEWNTPEAQIAREAEDASAAVAAAKQAAAAKKTEKAAAAEAKAAAKVAAEEARAASKFATAEAKVAARVHTDEAKQRAKAAADKAAAAQAHSKKLNDALGVQVAEVKAPVKRNRPSTTRSPEKKKRTGPPPSGAAKNEDDTESEGDDDEDDLDDLEDEGGEEGGAWAKKFRRGWQKEKRGWVGKRAMPHLGRARSPKGIVKNKWPLQSAVDTPKAWLGAGSGEDVVLQFWYKKLQACEMGPWQPSRAGVACIGAGSSLASEEEAKVAQKIRDDLIGDKLAYLGGREGGNEGEQQRVQKQLTQAKSWIIEEKLTDGQAGEPPRVKFVLPASGCPPSYPWGVEKEGGLQKYLFDKRPRAPPKVSPAVAAAAAKRKKESAAKARKDNKQNGGQKRSSPGGRGDDDHQPRMDRRTKSMAAAATVEPGDSSGSELWAKEDWEEARRLPMGVGVDAQIRAVLGIVIRRVELVDHQWNRWIETDRETDEKLGRKNHATHSVPMAIRAFMQDLLTSVAGVDVEARSLKRQQKAALKHTQHSGYPSHDVRVQARGVLQIYEALRNRRMQDYKKVDDAADHGYLRKRKQIWDGMLNTKGLKWKGGDHLLIVVPKHPGIETVSPHELSKLNLPPATHGQIAAGLEDMSTHDGLGMKALLAGSGGLGLAAATCVYIRNGVLSVGFLDGDLMGGIPADFGGMLPLDTKSFNGLQDKAWRKYEAVEKKREMEERLEEAGKRKRALAGGGRGGGTGGVGLSGRGRGSGGWASMLGPTAQVAAVLNDLVAQVVDDQDGLDLSPQKDDDENGEDLDDDDTNLQMGSDEDDGGEAVDNDEDGAGDGDDPMDAGDDDGDDVGGASPVAASPMASPTGSLGSAANSTPGDSTPGDDISMTCDGV